MSADIWEKVIKSEKTRLLEKTKIRLFEEYDSLRVDWEKTNLSKVANNPHAAKRQKALRSAEDKYREARSLSFESHRQDAKDQLTALEYAKLFAFIDKILEPSTKINELLGPIYKSIERLTKEVLEHGPYVAYMIMRRVHEQLDDGRTPAKRNRKSAIRKTLDSSMQEAKRNNIGFKVWLKNLGVSPPQYLTISAKGPKHEFGFEPPGCEPTSSTYSTTTLEKYFRNAKA